MTSIQPSLLRIPPDVDRILAVHPSISSKTKRCLDILGAIAGLLITALVLIPIAIAIQLDNP
ncbi:MAG TPA: anti-anti-sigma factor, partial [Microcoleaceae cyanobacterium]